MTTTPKKRTDLSTVTIMGNLTSDPAEAKTVGTDKKIRKLRIASHTSAREQDTLFIEVEAWNSLADSLDNLAKGDRIIVQGSLSGNNYEKDGKKNYGVKIVAQNIFFIKVKKFTEQAEAQAEATAAATPAPAQVVVSAAPMPPPPPPPTMSTVKKPGVGKTAAPAPVAVKPVATVKPQQETAPIEDYGLDDEEDRVIPF